MPSLAKCALLAALAAPASAVELTQDNYEAATAGKTVFLRLYDPWLSKKLKPAWEELTAEYAEDPTRLVGQVDCTSEGGKPLCDANGVTDFPKGLNAVMWGDPTVLREYPGGRTLDELREFAEEKLTPQCSVANLDLCDVDTKAQ